MFTAINLELDAAEQEARDILKKEGIDPDQIGRHFFGGWPFDIKVGFSDIGYIDPKLSDFKDMAHYAYRMLGAVMLMREMLKECKDDAEFRRMVYLMNLGQFFWTTTVGLYIKATRTAFLSESGGKGGRAKKGTYGPVSTLVQAIIKDLLKEKKPVSNKTITAKLRNEKYLKKFSDSFEEILLNDEEQTLSFLTPTDRGEQAYVIKISYLNKLISELKPK